jgi:hypothetical protein
VSEEVAVFARRQNMCVYYKNGFKTINTHTHTHTTELFPRTLRERERERERKRPPLVRREREGRKTTKETGKVVVSKSNLPFFDVFTSFYSFWVK